MSTDPNATIAETTMSTSPETPAETHTVNPYEFEVDVDTMAARPPRQSTALKPTVSCKEQASGEKKDVNPRSAPRQSTVLDLTSLRQGTIRRKLEALDVNKDGLVSLTEVMTAVNERNEAKSSVQKLYLVVLALLFVIVCTVGATVGLTYVVVQNSINTKIDNTNPDFAMLTDKNGKPILVNSAVVSTQLPLGAFQLLPDLLYQLHQVSYHEPSDLGFTQHVSTISSVAVYPGENIFQLTCTDGITIRVEGFVNATVTRTDGSQYTVCAACSSCAYESVVQTPAVEQAMVVYYAAVPDVNAACSVLVPAGSRRRGSIVQTTCGIARCPKGQYCRSGCCTPIVKLYITPTTPGYATAAQLGSQLPAVLLTEKTKLADFARDYNEIDGSITIQVAEDFSTVQLWFISVTGDLIITDCTYTTALNFPIMDTVGGSLIIRRSTFLPNLDGFAILSSIGRGMDAISKRLGGSSLSLSLQANAALQQINGLLTVTFIGRDVVITSNKQLQNIDGLQKVTGSITNLLQIQSNPVLTSIRGLGNLTSAVTPASIVIKDNPLLTSLSGLIGITTVTDSVIISGKNLTNIDALASLKNVGSLLSIYDAPMLTKVSPGLNGITHILGKIRISTTGTLSMCSAFYNQLSAAGTPVCAAACIPCISKCTNYQPGFLLSSAKVLDNSLFCTY